MIPSTGGNVPPAGGVIWFAGGDGAAPVIGGAVPVTGEGVWVIEGRLPVKGGEVPVKEDCQSKGAKSQSRETPNPVENSSLPFCLNVARTTNFAMLKHILHLGHRQELIPIR